MNLIMLYGPPAVGKLTIGTELAKRTGYHVFHNHLTVPAARAIFPAGHAGTQGRAYSDLLKRMRLDAIRAAASANVDIICTLAYSGDVDDTFITDIVTSVQASKGQVCFVQLGAPDAVLAGRVSNASRQALGKMTDPEKLHMILTTRDARARVKYPDVLQIDTSQQNPTQIVKHIVDAFTVLH